MNTRFCGQMRNVPDALNDVTDDLCRHQGRFNIAWVFIFFQVIIKENVQIYLAGIQTTEKTEEMKVAL